MYQLIFVSTEPQCTNVDQLSFPQPASAVAELVAIDDEALAIAGNGAAIATPVFSGCNVRRRRDIRR